jgi:hypothetical protein
MAHKGNFEIKGLGKCLVGTYAKRHLTKHFACSPQDLLFLAAKEGYNLEFTVYVLKFCFENAQIQEKGTGGYKEKSIDEIDSFLDENDISPSEYDALYNALWLSITGLTFDEYKANLEKENAKIEPSEEEKKSLTIESSGETLTNLDGQ